MTIRWGILGAGFVARQFAASLRYVKQAEIACVCSRNINHAKRFTDDFGGRAVDQHEALFRDQDIDVIYVATPTALHAEHSIACLKAGKAVLCEKPLATSLYDAERVIETARRNKCFLMEAIWTRFIPQMYNVRSRIQAGELGLLHCVQADLSIPVADDPSDQRTLPGPGAGALLDLGIYPISFALDLLGEPHAIQSHVLKNENGVDRQATIIMSYAESTATLTTSFNGRGRNDAIIIGEYGSMQLAAPLYAPEVLTTTMRQKSQPNDGGSQRGARRIDRIIENYGWVGVIYRPLLPIFRLITGHDRMTLKPFTSFGYQFEAKEVVRQLNAGNLESPIMPWSHSISIVRIIETVRDN